MPTEPTTGGAVTGFEDAWGKSVDGVNVAGGWDGNEIGGTAAGGAVVENDGAGAGVRANGLEGILEEGSIGCDGG